MDPGRFVSAGVHWGVSVFLLQPNLRGRHHFLRAVGPFRSCISSCVGVGVPPLGCFWENFWYCAVLLGGKLSVFGFDVFFFWVLASAIGFLSFYFCQVFVFEIIS